MTTDRSSTRVSRRGPTRLDLIRLTLQVHGRLIVWGVGLLVLTLGLGTFGILRTITVGEPVVHTATVIGIPSSQSIHVEVELESGSRMMVPRGLREDLVVGEVVEVTETTSALKSRNFQLTESTID